MRVNIEDAINELGDRLLALETMLDAYGFRSPDGRASFESDFWIANDSGFYFPRGDATDFYMQWVRDLGSGINTRYGFQTAYESVGYNSQSLLLEATGGEDKPEGLLNLSARNQGATVLVSLMVHTGYGMYLIYNGDAVCHIDTLGNLDLDGDTIRLQTSKTPATGGAAGNTGDICWDTSYIYVCVAPSTWKRAALTTW
jgi:hypothetical protein